MKRLLLMSTALVAFSLQAKADDLIKGDISVNADETKDLSSSDYSEKKVANWGGVVYNEGTISALSGKFSDNEAIMTQVSEDSYILGEGGAIYNGESGKIENASDVEFSNNTAVKGGAIYNAGTIALDKASFEENSAVSNVFYTHGGAIFNENSLNISKSDFDKNTADYGGAIHNIGTLTISQSTFTDNKAAESAGAISALDSSKLYITSSTFSNNTSLAEGAILAGTGTLETVIENSTFDGNSAGDIGAVGLFGTNGVVKGSTFTNNKATYTYDEKGDGAGALFFGSVSQSQVADSEFTSNSSGTVGGAIATRASLYWGGSRNSQAKAKLDISGSTFTDNKAGTNGGAFYNTFYNGDKNDGYVTVSSSTFTNNSADENGGAIYNDGEVDHAGNYAKLWIEDSTFTNNTASQNGGAIYNAKNATLVLAGTNEFSGNKDANGLNDIYNDGALSVSGDLTLDGGISGSGTTTFAKDTNISVKVNDTTISNTVVNNGANLNLIFSDSFDGEYTLVSGSLDNEFNGYDSNSLYNISSVENGTYKVSKKSTDEIVESLATTKDTANVIDALTSGKSEDNTAFNNIAGNINDMLQSGDSAKVKAAIDAATAVSTETAPMIHHVQTTNVNQIFGAVASRLSSGSVAGNQGISSGDSILERGAVWLKGIYNRAKLENDTIKNKKGFTADSNGVAFGAEKYFGDSVKAGLGYAYTDTDVDGFLRDTDIDTNTAFVYGEYKPNNWFVNAIASYNWSDYKEEKSVLGNQIKGDYDVDTVAAQIMTGYDFHFGTTKITPSAGLRYVHVKQDAYTDTLGSRVDDNKYDIWTAVAGASISKDFTYKNIVLRPEVRAAATYDLKNDDASANVVLANNAAYHVNGESLKRFGVEVGAGLTAELTDSIEVSAAYEGRFRQNYYDNTGMLSAKYKF